MPWEMKVVATLVIYFTFVSVSSGNDHTRTSIPQGKITWKSETWSRFWSNCIFFYYHLQCIRNAFLMIK